MENAISCRMENTFMQALAAARHQGWMAASTEIVLTLGRTRQSRLHFSVQLRPFFATRDNLLSECFYILFFCFVRLGMVSIRFLHHKQTLNSNANLELQQSYAHLEHNVHCG